MAGQEEDSAECGAGDFYAVLGLKKECTDSELRNAYKKLALRWHPDRCSAAGNSRITEEAKRKFQDIQQAYAVLSDANKRFLYDVGVYESDDDENGMGDFLNEMATMMTQNKPSANGEESFEDLKDLFEEMFQGDLGSFSMASSCSSSSSSSSSSSFSPRSPSTSYIGGPNANNKRSSSQMRAAAKPSSIAGCSSGFCIGTGGTAARGQDKRRSRR